MLIQPSELLYLPGHCLTLLLEFQRKLRNNKVRVTAADFPAFLYPNDGFDPDDLESGLFRSPILVRVSVIFRFCLIHQDDIQYHSFSNIFSLRRHRQSKTYRPQTNRKSNALKHC